MNSTIWHFIQKTSSVWKSAASAGIAWEIAKWTGAEKPYFAPLAAILCIQVTVAESIWKGYQRVVGIIAGVLLADTIGRYLGIHGWSIALIVLIGTGVATLFRFGAQAIPQVGISAMMVLTVGGGHYVYGWDRIVDTILGAVIAVVVNMVVLPPDFSADAVKAVYQAAEDLQQHYLHIEQLLKNDSLTAKGREVQEETRNYVDKLHVVENQLDTALKALRYSPLVKKRRTRLNACKTALLCLRQGYAHATGMLRTLIDWHDSGTFTDADKAMWIANFAMFAKQIGEWGRAFGEAHPQKKFAASIHLEEVAPVDELYRGALYNDARQFTRDFSSKETVPSDHVVE